MVCMYEREREVSGVRCPVICFFFQHDHSQNVVVHFTMFIFSNTCSCVQSCTHKLHQYMCWFICGGCCMFIFANVFWVHFKPLFAYYIQ